MKTKNENSKLKRWLRPVIRLVARGWAKAAGVNKDVMAELDREYRKAWGDFKGKGLL